MIGTYYYYYMKLFTFLTWLALWFTWSNKHKVAWYNLDSLYRYLISKYLIKEKGVKMDCDGDFMYDLLNGLILLC